MGAKEILAYRDQEVMSAKQFFELWLAEYPKDQPHDVAQILSELVATERSCIHIPNTNPKTDWLRDDVAETRNDLKRRTLASLRQMAEDRGGIDAVPTVTLRREGLVKALAKLEIPGPRFLYPPAPSSPFEAALTQRVDHTPPPAAQAEPLLYSHSEDFSTMNWYGHKVSFSPKQACHRGRSAN
jgi:hypothetical protein